LGNHQNVLSSIVTDLNWDEAKKKGFLKKKSKLRFSIIFFFSDLYLEKLGVHLELEKFPACFVTLLSSVE
jgi:hypothetical protein